MSPRDKVFLTLKNFVKTSTFKHFPYVGVVKWGLVDSNTFEVIGFSRDISDLVPWILSSMKHKELAYVEVLCVSEDQIPDPIQVRKHLEEAKETVKRETELNKSLSALQHRQHRN